MIQVSNLVKLYKGTVAVDGISFSSSAGECLGLLGPNGAGKTTTMEIIEGIKDATSGDISFEGKSMNREFKNKAGIMFQTTALPQFITCKEALQLFGSLYPKSESIDTLIRKCDLGDFINRDTQKLSGGQKQRLLLAIALIGKPKVLFLDEPTTGLDPSARRNLWDIITEQKKLGTSIILSTHYMDEAYKLCDRIIIMNKGKIIAEGSPAKLLESHFNEVVMELAEDSGIDNAIGVDYHMAENVAAIFTKDVQETIDKLKLANVKLNTLRIRSRTLEDLFLDIT